MTTNKINFRSTIVALAFGALVTVTPASAATITYYGASLAPGTPTIGVGGYDWTYTPVTAPQMAEVFGSTPSTESFGSFYLYYPGRGSAPTATSQVFDIDVQPTDSSGHAVSTALVFQATAVETNGTYSLMFSTGNGAVAGTGQYAGDIVQTATINGQTYTYAVPTDVTNLSPGKSFSLNGLIGVGGAVAPEPATLATTGLAAAFLGLFLRRKTKQS